MGHVMHKQNLQNIHNVHIVCIRISIDSMQFRTYSSFYYCKCILYYIEKVKYNS